MIEMHNIIKHILRIITPEEISEIATRHNGGKFLSLTELAYERFKKNISRDFSNVEKLAEDDLVKVEAKILPFTDGENVKTDEPEVVEVKKVTHGENENMATFILIEKERLKKSQLSLKQKEIIDLYKKNSHVDVEQIKQTNHDAGKSDEWGVLINKKHY